MRRVLIGMGVGLCCLVSWWQSPAAADEIRSLSVQLPRELPAGLPTVLRFPATSGGTSLLPGRASWLFDDPRLEPGGGWVQSEADGMAVWVTIGLKDAKLAGQTVSLVMKPFQADGRVTIARQPHGLQVSDHGRPVLFFRAAPKSRDGGHTRAGYVHPVWGLDGEVLTQEFPDDHPHHHGVFWAWHQLWVGDLAAGDPWVTQDFLAVVREVQMVEAGPLFATLAAEVDWTSPKLTDGNGAPRPIIREHTTIRVFHAVHDIQYVDFDIRLRALMNDVRLGGADNERGYSGFTVRVKPPRQMAIHDDQGRLSADSVGRTSRWADVSGQYADTATGNAGLNEAAISGLGILAHPGLPEFPPKWLLRFYGMQNVVYPGRHPVAVPTDSELRLRHRLVIYRGPHTKARVAEHQGVYELTP